MLDEAGPEPPELLDADAPAAPPELAALDAALDALPPRLVLAQPACPLAAEAPPEPPVPHALELA